MEVKKTKRGFEIIEFEDCSGGKCSLQQSSSVDSRIWVGANEGTHVEGQCCARMHLDRVTTRELIIHLQKWLVSNSFEGEVEIVETHNETKLTEGQVTDIYEIVDKLEIETDWIEQKTRNSEVRDSADKINFLVVKWLCVLGMKKG